MMTTNSPSINSCVLPSNWSALPGRERGRVGAVERDHLHTECHKRKLYDLSPPRENARSAPSRWRHRRRPSVPVLSAWPAAQGAIQLALRLPVRTGVQVASRAHQRRGGCCASIIGLPLPALWCVRCGRFFDVQQRNWSTPAKRPCSKFRSRWTTRPTTCRLSCRPATRFEPLKVPDKHGALHCLLCGDEFAV